jgi:hypothetical protein
VTIPPTRPNPLSAPRAVARRSSGKTDADTPLRAVLASAAQLL